MKTIVLLLLLANGVIWPAVANNLHRSGVTVIFKQAPVSKPRVVQWSI